MPMALADAAAFEALDAAAVDAAVSAGAADAAASAASTSVPSAAVTYGESTVAQAAADPGAGGDGASRSLSASPAAPADTQPVSETIGAGPQAETGNASPSDTQAKQIADQLVNGKEATPEQIAAGTNLAPAAAAPAAQPASVAMGTPAAEAPSPVSAAKEMGYTPEKPGIITQAISDTAKTLNANPGAATVIAGAVGGGGKGAFEQAMNERTIESRKQLLSQQTEEQQRLSQLGTYRGKSAASPSGTRAVRRPDGTLVYAPGGIINRQVTT